VLAGHHLLWVHKNKTKKYDDEHQLIIVFSQCTKTKQKKMMMSVGLSLSSFNAQKQNKKDYHSSSSFTTNEKRGNLGEKCTCILANMISLVL